MANRDFYKEAEAYDIAFSERDFPSEMDFCVWAFNKFNQIKNPGEVKNFLELASGPSRHALEMAKRGWRSYALDLSEYMLEYASKVAKEAGVEISTIAADMTEFKTDERFELIGNFTESVTHLTSNEMILAHLKNASRHLLPGGIYVIETAHPRYFFPDGEANFWTSAKNGTKVEVIFGEPSDSYDSVNQVWNVTTKLRIFENGKKIKEISSVSAHRWLLAQELKALIQLSGEFDYWLFGDMEVEPSELEEDSECMIAVLRKKADRA